MNNSYQEAIDKVKSLICKDTTLHYFNVCKPVPLQVDASQKGLGAVLLQNRCPVDQCYTNIEHELFDLVFEAEQFDTYVFDHAFTIESDHKPLEQINIKNLGRYASLSTENAATTLKL